jgi:hypothetical protein
VLSANRCGRKFSGDDDAASVEERGKLAETANFEQYTPSRYKILPTTK